MNCTLNILAPPISVPLNAFWILKCLWKVKFFVISCLLDTATLIIEGIFHNPHMASSIFIYKLASHSHKIIGTCFKGALDAIKAQKRNTRTKVIICRRLISYSIVVGVATNNCLRCQTAPVAKGIETSPRYLNWGRKEEITMYCW